MKAGALGAYVALQEATAIFRRTLSDLPKVRHSATRWCKALV